MRRRLVKDAAVATARTIFRCCEHERSSVLESNPPKVTRFLEHITNRIDTLRATAVKNQLVSLSSNQVEVKHNNYCIINQLCGNVGKWTDAAYCNPSDYESILNPVITGISSTTNIQEESCPSYPKLLCARERFDEVTVQYVNFKREPVQRRFTGFAARVFQHEFDHLMGVSLFFSEVNQGNIRFEPSAEKDFPRTIEILHDFNRQVKKVLRDYPELFPRPTLQTINDGVPENLISFEQDLVRRLLKHYKRELALFEARQSMNLP